MTIHLEVDPETELQLIEKARAQGMEPEGYASQVFKAAIAAAPVPRPRATQEQFRAFLDELARQTIPPLPFDDQNWSRAIIYGDHD